MATQQRQQILRSRTYRDKVLATRPGSLLAYWPLSEQAGVIAADASGRERNGVTSGAAVGQAGIGDGASAYVFDGINDYIDVYPSLPAHLNGSSGTVMCWCRVSALAVWSDLAQRTVLRLRPSTNNYIQVYKGVTANTITFQYRAGGVTNQIDITESSADWLCIAATWSAAQNQIRFFLRGIPAAPVTGLGAWDNTVTITTQYAIGVGTTAGTSSWSGSLAHCAVWSSVLSDAEIAALAVNHG